MAESVFGSLGGYSSFSFVSLAVVPHNQDKKSRTLVILIVRNIARKNTSAPSLSETSLKIKS